MGISKPKIKAVMSLALALEVASVFTRISSRLEEKKNSNVIGLLVGRT